MKSKEGIKTTTDFWNDLMKEMWENESGYSFEHFNRVMQEYATQQTSSIQAERDEYRKALQELADSCINVKYNITKKPLLKFVNQAFCTLNKYPQQ